MGRKPDLYYGANLQCPRCLRCDKPADSVEMIEDALTLTAIYVVHCHGAHVRMAFSYEDTRSGRGIASASVFADRCPFEYVADDTGPWPRCVGVRGHAGLCQDQGKPAPLPPLPVPPEPSMAPASETTQVPGLDRVDQMNRDLEAAKIIMDCFDESAPKPGCTCPDDEPGHTDVRCPLFVAPWPQNRAGDYLLPPPVCSCLNDDCLSCVARQLEMNEHPFDTEYSREPRNLFPERRDPVVPYRRWDAMIACFP